MPRTDKVQAVADIKQRLEGASAVFLTEYRGLPVARQQQLRASLREAGAAYKVLKMSLTRRALDDLGMEGMEEWLTGPTALAFIDDDPVPAARALADFAKDNDAFLIKGGWWGGEAIGAEVVSRLANIDSREVLLAKIAGAVQAPLNKMASAMGSFTRDAASLFSALLERREEGDGGEEAPQEAAAAPDGEGAAAGETAEIDQDNQAEQPKG